MADYVLVTPARNMEQYLEGTIQAVLGQTEKPARWVIVSDGSTDGTDSIARHYAGKQDWIEFVRHKPVPRKRGVPGSGPQIVAAFDAGVERLSDVQYDFIGKLDADITFGPRYYERVLRRMEDNPYLGIAGGGIYNVTEEIGEDGGEPWFVKRDVVGGGIQLFRRECYEDIGGYWPGGHTDCVAVVMAKRRGWEVRCFPEIPVFHHKVPSNTVRTKVPNMFYCGRMDRGMGTMFWYEILRCVRRMVSRPLFVAGLARMAGYMYAGLTREPLQIPPEAEAALRQHQRKRFRGAISALLPGGREIGDDE